ncbi:MAG: hypothetical protein ACE5OZ_21905 [Candidatus Heimdallarchaeota archaeon]
MLETTFPLHLAFAPVELRKPTTNASWQDSFHTLTFKKITTLVLELEPLDLPGQLESLTVDVTINGQRVTKLFETKNYAFDAPTQLALVVDTTTRKLDHSVDFQLLLEPQWGFLDAGVRILIAQLHSFDSGPSFGEGLGKVPLSVEWNAYRLGGIPPLSLYFTTIGYLGNALGSNQLRLNFYLELEGVDSPWVELFYGTKQLHQGSGANQWINTTITPQAQNLSQMAVTVEYHPHRSADRNKEVKIRLEVFAEFANYVDPNKAERDEMLAEMPRIPTIVSNILILNAIFLPLVHFRRQYANGQKRNKKSQIIQEGDRW